MLFGSDSNEYPARVPSGSTSFYHKHVPQIDVRRFLSGLTKKSFGSGRLWKAGDVRNYRPISNLTFISKLIERLVYSQLFNFLEQHKLLPKFQFGFSKFHSTETAVLKVISDIAMATDAGEVTLLGLLDMSAAFDTVDHSILVNRIETLFGF